MINLCEPDKYNGTHPNADPRQLSPAKIGEVTVTMSEDNAEFQAIVREAVEAQQITRLESSTKLKWNTGEEDRNNITVETEGVSSSNPVQLVSSPPQHHLHPQVVEEVGEVLPSSQRTYYIMHGENEDQRHHHPPQHFLAQGHSVVRAFTDKYCEYFHNGRQPIITQRWYDSSTIADRVGSSAGEGIMEAEKSSASISPCSINSVHCHSMAVTTASFPTKPSPQLPATTVNL